MTTSSFTPRPSQEKILAYNGGRLGIAAVPGAGKTHILSALAARIIQSGTLQDGQEVLIVTLVNSAVDNFETRLKGFFANPLQALFKYRVRTLHGLAHDIVREKPASVGLDERFNIIDEREANFIRQELVNSWLVAHAFELDDFLDPAMDASKQEWVKRQKLPSVLDTLANAFIRSAKDRLLTPDNLCAKLEASPAPLPLARLGCSIYMDYQRALAYRGAVDFDDLIRLALNLLQTDHEYLERLRFRYPYILEDEAQDSSRTQENILKLLSGEDGNWVRVGDPNQAIFETFTTASPELLRRFIQENPSVPMPESGRSQPAIIEVANQLIDWVMHSHPNPQARTALSTPHITPAPPGDPQQNPPYKPEDVKFIGKRYTPEEEIGAVAKSVKALVDSIADRPIEEQPTIAILVPRNQRGVEVVNELRKRGVEPVELISSTTETRAAAGSLNHLLIYLADPGSARKLAKAYEVFRRDWREDAEKMELTRYVESLLKNIREVENFIAPAQPDGWESAFGEDEAEEVLREAGAFRTAVQRWLGAVTLPIDQLALTLAQDVFTAASDLALGHKLALVLRQIAEDHPDWRLPELAAELAVIARNQRRFIGFSDEDSGFDPEKHRGRVVVATMHKAKGLEWDRVYLMSLNNYDFPSDLPGDDFMSEKWFVRGKLNLEAEALAQLQALTSHDAYGWYEEGHATHNARLDYVKERLRLLYVGMTRAKRELIMTWNTGRQGNATPAMAMSELMGQWEKKRNSD